MASRLDKRRLSLSKLFGVVPLPSANGLLVVSRPSSHAKRNRLRGVEAEQEALLTSNGDISILLSGASDESKRNATSVRGKLSGYRAQNMRKLWLFRFFTGGRYPLEWMTRRPCTSIFFRQENCRCHAIRLGQRVKLSLFEAV